MASFGKGIDRGARDLVRIRRTLQKLAEGFGIIAGDGIAFDEDTFTLSIDLSATSGLEFNSGQLQIDVGDGVTLTASGLELDLASPSGLEFNSGALRIDANTGITIDANGVNLDIDGLTVETTADNADTIAIYDDSAGAIRKMSREDFLGGGTGGGGGIGSLDQKWVLPYWPSYASNYLCTSGTIYAIYLGYVTVGVRVEKVRVYVNTAFTFSGSGQSVEAGIYSSTAAPNGSAVGLVLQWSASLAVSNFTTTGWKEIGSSGSTITSGNHIWAGIRVDAGLSGTMGRIGPAIAYERGSGYVLEQSGAGTMASEGDLATMDLSVVSTTFSGPFLMGVTNVV